MYIMSLPFLKPQISIFSKCLLWSKRGEHNYLHTVQKPEKELCSFLQCDFMGSIGEKKTQGERHYATFALTTKFTKTNKNCFTLTRKATGHLYTPITA